WDGPTHNPPPVFYGWDEQSLYNWGPPIVADDWHCTDQRPVTDIHWWGSFIGWTQPDPPQMPDAFHIGIWTDVPAGIDKPFSHPGRLIWENYCTSFVWNFAGYDHDPRGLIENEACFQFNQYLNPDEYFYQDPGPDGNIYWISISAIYQQLPVHPWGWKTRPHFFQDDAVRITDTSMWPPAVGSEWTGGEPIEFPQGISWDVAFELSTLEAEVGACCYDDPAGPGVILCQVTDQITCEQMLLGSWKGPGTDCTDADGNGVADICEEQPEEMEYGDAPEGVLAYPASGVIGMFPTCLTMGPATVVRHMNFGAWLGPQFDMELDGNAGLCPGFSPYDNDECFQDGDAGLLMPPAYTIDATNNVRPCMASQTGSLGQTCQTAVWGMNIDVEVHNHMPSNTIGYLNVLIDWDQNGQWGGASPCPLANAPEHVLVNFQIPNPFDGPVSALMAAGTGFLIGPNTGEVWMRVSITEQPVPVNWDGSGSFEDGETEDYLLNVEQPKHDLGDAPDSTNTIGVAMTAYPPGGPPGVQANYPTVFAAGSPPYGPIHLQPTAIAFLGNAVTLENEADIGPDQDPTNNIIPAADQPDNDGADDGLLLPLVFPHCFPAQFNYVVTAVGPMAAPLYVNAWCDWNRDGDWDDIMPCPLGSADEWAVQNEMVIVAGPGIYTFTSLPFLPWHPPMPTDPQPLWVRITLSEQAWQPGAGILGYGGSGPAAGYEFGETEDYFVMPEVPEPPRAIAWRSIRNHGALGPLAINLDPSATGTSVKSESRNGGIQLIEVDFDQAVVLVNPAGITVTDSPGGVAYVPSSVTMVDADTIAIGFASGLLPDMNCYRIDLDSCVQSSLASLPLAGDIDCWVRALIGDANGSGVVNTIDMALVKSKIGQSPALPGNPRVDVNLSGTINTIDMALVKSKIPNAAPCP
ncbi:MAG: hypothetical protein GX616_06355, partial [Planctomycetes bacterium]|nr:hypothetical protein [Planctomycetota bacterium]